MSLARSLFLTAALVAFGSASAAETAEPPPKKVVKKIKMAEPMAGGMKKPGMMKGDMKTAAEQKDRKMDEMMKKEEKAAK